MHKTILPVERIIRVVGGAVLASMAFWGPQNMWFLLGLIPLATGLMGWCPPYAMLGINTAIASETGSYAGYSFAIPVNLAISIANDIIKNGGNIERTSLGVEVFVVDEQFAKEQKLGVSEGLLVNSVGENSAAQYAGVLPNDVLMEIDGKKLGKFDDLKQKIDMEKVGDSVLLKVYRNGKYLDIPVRLKKGL